MLNGWQDAEFLQDGDTRGEQRFADVMARKALSFEQDHLVALARQHGGDGAPTGSAADDQHMP